MTNRGIRRTGAITALASAGFALIATPADAVVKPHSIANSIQVCLKDGYFAGDLQTAYSPSTHQTYHLRCGSHGSNSGMLHIADAHPIDENNVAQIEQFELCLQRLIQYGVHEESANSTRWWWDGKYEPRYKVGGATDNKSHEIKTVYTPGSNSANWAACSR